MQKLYIAIFKGGGYSAFTSEEALQRDREFFKEIEYVLLVSGDCLNLDPITLLPKPIE